MPHLAQKPHRWRAERVIAWELHFGGEDAAFVGGAVGPGDQRFPGEDVVFGDGAGGDAVGGVGGEEFVFVEEAAGGEGGGHGVCGFGGEGGLVLGVRWGWWVGGRFHSPYTHNLVPIDPP